MIDFKDMATYLGLFYVNCFGESHIVYVNDIHLIVYLFLTSYFLYSSNLQSVVWFQVFLSNTNNLQTVVWFRAFLSNIDNLHTVVWFQVFLSNTNNLQTVVWFCMYMYVYALTARHDDDDICIYACLYIYIYISSSSCRAGSTDIPYPLSPLLPIVHRLRQVFRTVSRILT